MAGSDRVLAVLSEVHPGLRFDLRRQPSGNNEVFVATSEDGPTLVGKAYASPEQGDDRDRLSVEFDALSFLWSNGVKCVPEPLAADRERRVGIYARIEGENPDPITEVDIDAAVDLLFALKALRDQPDAAKLPNASEACFSGDEYVASVQSRVRRFEALHSESKIDEEAISLISARLIPMLNRLRDRVGPLNLLPVERTLSPSDFGFHNALRRSGGAIAYLDFEYFGWDDPAKMISDFLLHPGQHLPDSLQHRFLKRMLTLFDVEARLESVFPLLVLKWCFILLNEFLPGPRARRRAAAGASSDDGWLEGQLRTQLEKAERMADMADRVLQPGFTVEAAYA